MRATSTSNNMMKRMKPNDATVDGERQQPEDVAEQDEEEQRPEEAQVLPAPLRAEPGVDDLVPQPNERELQQPGDPLLRGYLLGPPGQPGEEHDGEHGDAPEEQ